MRSAVRAVRRPIAVLLVAAGGVLAGCTETTAAGPITVTETVTSQAPVPAGDRAPDADPLPCDAAHVQTVIAPGEGPARGVWRTEIVVTNLGGPDSCWLDGELDM
jgi:hypothetical protein